MRVAHATVARIPLIKPATLILWHEQDRLLLRSYASAIGAKAEIEVIVGTGREPVRCTQPVARLAWGPAGVASAGVSALSGAWRCSCGAVGDPGRVGASGL